MYLWFHQVLANSLLSFQESGVTSDQEGLPILLGVLRPEEDLLLSMVCTSVYVRLTLAPLLIKR